MHYYLSSGELIMEEFPWIVISDAIYNDMEKTEKLLDKTVENMNADQITEVSIEQAKLKDPTTCQFTAGMRIRFWP